MNHNLTPSAVMEFEIAELAALPPAVLADLQADCKADLVQAQDRLGRLEAAIGIRYADQARAGLAEKGGTGTVHLDDGDYDVTVSCTKTVEWDEDALFDLLETLAPEDAKHFAKLKVSIDERKYQAAPPALRSEFEKLRTVKPGKMKFAFAKHKQAAA